MLTLPGHLVGPEHQTRLVVGVAAEASLGVESAGVGTFHLMCGVGPDRVSLSLGTVERGGVGAEGEPHEDPVQPDLIGIDSLVPVDAVGDRARLLVELAEHSQDSSLDAIGGKVLLILDDEMTRADIVDIVVEETVACDSPIGGDHSVDIHLEVVVEVVSAIDSPGVEDTLEGEATVVAPADTCASLWASGVRDALDLGGSHPDACRGLPNRGRLGEGQRGDDRKSRQKGVEDVRGFHCCDCLFRKDVVDDEVGEEESEDARHVGDRAVGAVG